uniref:Uncharacterized protein n=1 Tax=Arundo donax TaxID=35708 RepID=A0A0A8XXR1_ARUDO
MIRDSAMGVLCSACLGLGSSDLLTGPSCSSIIGMALNYALADRYCDIGSLRNRLELGDSGMVLVMVILLFFFAGIYVIYLLFTINVSF